MASTTDSTIAGSGLFLALLLSACLGHAQDATQPTKEAAKATLPVLKKERPPFDLTYVPADVTGVIAIRPNVIFDDPAMQPLARLANQSFLMQVLLPYLPSADLKLPIQEIEQVVLYMAPPLEKRSKGDEYSTVGTVMIRAAHDFDWLKLMKHIDPKTKEVRHGDWVYYRSHPKVGKEAFFSEIPISPKATFCYVIPDKRTLVLLPLDLRALENGETVQRPHFSWDKDWKHVEHDLFAIAQSHRPARGASKKQIGDELPDCAEWTALTKNVATMVAGVDWKDGIDLQAYLAYKDPAAAKRATGDLKAFLAQSRRDLVQDAPADVPEAAKAAIAFQMRLWEELIDGVRITRKESTVGVHSKAKMNVAEVAKGLLSQYEPEIWHSQQVSPARKSE